MRANLLLLLTISFAVLTMTSCRKRCGCDDEYAVNFENHVREDDGSCEYQPRIDDLDYSIYSCEAPYDVDITARIYPKPNRADYNFQNTISIDYGDGTRETIFDDNFKGVVHTYAQAGNYTVIFKVSNDWGMDEKLLTISIDPNAPTEAGFKMYTNTANCLEGASIDLRNTSYNASSYEWTFGDGTSSTQVSPKHTYTQPGNYTITLKASCGATEAIHTTNVEVKPVQAEASFGYSAEHDNYKAPALLYFDNTSHDADEYTWYVNGQVVSHDEHLDYKFMLGGTYNVELIARSCSAQADSSVYKQTIVIDNVPSSFSIKKATFWFPVDNFLPDTYYDQYYGMELYAILKYNGNSIGSSINILDVDTESVTFTFPSDLHIGSFGLTNFAYGNNNQVTIELWDTNDGIGNDVKLYSFPFNTSHLQEEYYPGTINWDIDGAGYGAEINIVY
ncbi:MAG: PKD domain-containing protein [Aureispira sp.]|nr:PKD domain-containing protein [Aureispira sp.]